METGDTVLIRFALNAAEPVTAAPPIPKFIVNSRAKTAVDSNHLPFNNPRPC